MAVNWTYEYYCTRLGVKFINGDHFICKGKGYTSAYTNSASLGYDFSNEPTEKIFYGVASDPNYPEKIGYPILFCHISGSKQYYIQDSAIYQNVSGTQMNYTLTLNANGGTANSNGSSLTVTLNSQNYNAISSWLPSRTGYQLQGMYTSASGGTKVYNADGSITNDGTYWSNNVWIYKGNVTLYAQWKGNTYYVKYNANGGSGSMSNSTHTYGTASKLTANAFTKTGYDFAGWATTSSGSIAHLNQASVTTLTSTNGGTVNLYAKWTAQTKTLYFDANGGSTSTASKSVTYDSTYGTLPTPSRDGYTFNGWYTAKSGGTKITDTTKVTTVGNHTLYAQWTGRTYYVKYNGNGNTGGSMSNSTHVYGTSKALTANAFTKTGNDFFGWATSASGSKAYGNQESVLNLTTTSGGTVNLYALWTPYVVNLTINPNSGTWGGSSSTQTFPQTYGTTKTIANPSRTGYAFSSWTLSGGGSLSGTTYTYGASDGTLTAQWTINKYTLTINPNGGTWNSTTSNSTASQNYNTTKTIANPTRADYTFTGWTLTGAGSMSGTTFTFGAGDATLTAQWYSNNSNIYCYK